MCQQNRLPVVLGKRGVGDLLLVYASNLSSVNSVPLCLKWYVHLYLLLTVLQLLL